MTSPIAEKWTEHTRHTLTRSMKQLLTGHVAHKLCKPRINGPSTSCLIASRRHRQCRDARSRLEGSAGRIASLARAMDTAGRRWPLGSLVELWSSPSARKMAGADRRAPGIGLAAARVVPARNRSQKRTRMASRDSRRSTPGWADPNRCRSCSRRRVTQRVLKKTSASNARSSRFPRPATAHRSGQARLAAPHSRCCGNKCSAPRCGGRSRATSSSAITIASRPTRS